MNGWEMANAYSEAERSSRSENAFQSTGKLLAQGDDEANTTDEDFLNALEIPVCLPAGGIPDSESTECMLLTNGAAIRDVLLFPTISP